MGIHCFSPDGQGDINLVMSMLHVLEVTPLRPHFMLRSAAQLLTE